MAIEAVRPRAARWAALLTFVFAALAVVGRQPRTMLPPADIRVPPSAPRPVAAAPVAAAGPRGVSCAALSLVLPGAGQLHGGARARGAAMLGVVVALLVGTLVLARQDVVFLVGQALRTEVLLGALALNAAVLLFRAASVADAWRLGRRPARRGARVALLGSMLAVVALPHALAAGNSGPPTTP
jgi:hypothetical protein